MPTTITQQRAVTTRVTQHDLSIHGRSGSVLFILLFCLLTFIVAFATPGWNGNIGSHNGLWESCSRSTIGGSYHVATQVLMCLALIGLVVAVILIFLYLFATTVSKYQVLLGLVIDTFITFGLLLVAIIVYGAEAPRVYWSYGVAVISTILCLCAAIISAIQLSQC